MAPAVSAPKLPAFFATDAAISDADSFVTFNVCPANAGKSDNASNPFFNPLRAAPPTDAPSFSARSTPAPAKPKSKFSKSTAS